MLASGTVRPATPSEDIVVEIISVKKGPAVVIPAVQRKPDAVSALSSVDPDDVDFKTNVKRDNGWYCRFIFS